MTVYLGDRWRGLVCMALDQRIVSILLAGVRFPPAQPLPPAAPPAAISRLIAAVAPLHMESNARAIQAGRRYRAAFWSLYLLSPLAVLCALMQLVSGVHGAWALAEVAVIMLLGTVYLRGHRQDWQGRWLASRTEAELAWYLPLLAPLVVPGMPGAAANWYARLAGNALHPPPGGAIEDLCRRLEGDAAVLLQHAWDDPAFAGDYGRWAASRLASQRAYHQRLALHCEALRARVHAINAWLFGLTLAGALAHLVLHAPWLALPTIVFPALGASLHGALAQTESYRLAAASRRLGAAMEEAIGQLATLLAAGDAPGLRRAIEAALILILEEHRDWQMLVRPHQLHLA